MNLSNRMYYVWLDALTTALQNGTDYAVARANADLLVTDATERFTWITDDTDDQKDSVK